MSSQIKSDAKIPKPVLHEDCLSEHTCVTLFDMGAAMSDKIIAPCGLDCATCPARTATVNDDDELRAETAMLWSSSDHTTKPEDINCLSCLNADAPSMFAEHCPVRKCAIERGAETCAHCGEFACPVLEKHWDFLGKKDEIRANLQAIRQTLDSQT